MRAQLHRQITTLLIARATNSIAELLDYYNVKLIKCFHPVHSLLEMEGHGIQVVWKLVYKR
jgi:hypothetical protein